MIPRLRDGRYAPKNARSGDIWVHPDYNLVYQFENGQWVFKDPQAVRIGHKMSDQMSDEHKYRAMLRELFRKGVAWCLMGTLVIMAMLALAFHWY